MEPEETPQVTTIRSAVERAYNRLATINRAFQQADDLSKTMGDESANQAANQFAIDRMEMMWAEWLDFIMEQRAPE